MTTAIQQLAVMRRDGREEAWAMATYRVRWLGACVPLVAFGAAAAAAGSVPAAVSWFVVAAVVGGVLTLSRGNVVLGPWLRAIRTAPLTRLDAVAPAVVPARPELAQARVLEQRDLTDEQLCRRWRNSFRASPRQPSSTVTSAEDAAERRMYLDELERRNPSGFAAWLAAGPRAVEDPLPYISGDHVDVPVLDWDELTRGLGS